jgi:hypothetical protein
LIALLTRLPMAPAQEKEVKAEAAAISA